MCTSINYYEKISATMFCFQPYTAHYTALQIKNKRRNVIHPSVPDLQYMHPNNQLSCKVLFSAHYTALQIKNNAKNFNLVIFMIYVIMQ